MLDWFATYGADLTALILALGSLATAIYGILKVIKSEKKSEIKSKSVDEKLQITREGIVEAFKTAKIPTDIKISISKQVDSKLNEFRDSFLATMKENEMLRTEAMVMILKILSYTAASSKLTEEEKAKINDLVKLISEADATIDITE